MSQRSRQPNGNFAGAGNNHPPNGVCREFWRDGRCRFTNCKYRHERPGQIAATTSTSQRPDGRGARGSTFSQQPLQVVQATSSLNIGMLDAGRVSLALNKFCSATGALQTLHQVHMLIDVLASIASDSSPLSTEDRQTALDQLTNDYGKMRLQDLLEYDQVTAWLPDAPQSLSFQSGYIHTLSLFTCKSVVASTLKTRSNLLYSLIHGSYDTMAATIIRSMDAIVAKSSVQDNTILNPKAMSFPSILEVLVMLFKEYLDKFKSAPTDHPSIREFPTHLGRWLEYWRAASSFTDLCNVNEADKTRLVGKLHRDIERLATILYRDTRPTANTTTTATTNLPQTHPRRVAHIHLASIHGTFVPPGELRESGPRHDNDHANILDIAVAPTQQELMSDLPSFIPSTLYDAPHHLPMQSMDRLMDIQFRLLREEILCPIKASMDFVFHDLKAPPSQSTQLQQILAAQGGRYKGEMERDSVFFSVYTNVQLGAISADRRGISVSLSFDTPPGKGRNKAFKDREAYWKNFGRKRLNSGGLIALLWNKTEIHLGLITSRTDDLIESAKQNERRLSIRVSFFGSEIEHRAIKGILSTKKSQASASPHIFLEIPMLFEASRPFLEALKVEPTSVAFAKYLVQREEGVLSNVKIDPPAYAVRQGFEWNLSSLFNPPLPWTLSMRPGDPNSVQMAEMNLKWGQDTRLDPSEAEAVISCLTREVALIQGPPGTGKSYTAIQLLRVLIQNRIGKILMVAFTNHALDHLLESVLNAGITEKVVRLGSRSQSERLQELTLDKLEKFQATFMKRGFNSAYGAMKGADKAFNDFINDFDASNGQSLNDVESLLQLNYPFQHESLVVPSVPTRMTRDEILGAKAFQFPDQYQFWEQGRDIKNKARGRARPINSLLSIQDVWSLTQEERKIISKKWKEEASSNGQEIRMTTYESLKKTHLAARETVDEYQMMQRLEALQSADIVGCTTSGAARLLNLLKGLQPKVILVEEAGQVLEAHSLATLVPSVEHLIMIGDPQQLRPNINNYKFATENPRGGEFFKFDQSLMERLASLGLPMSQLTIQRRMRPAVSNLIRRCLYPKLEDHDSVKQYPSVRGMAKDVWFLHHTNKEAGGGDDGVSKCNPFEVEMVKSLVQFFLRQGVYNNPTSIVVLCMYLGQLVKIRDALASCKLSVVLDERDENTLLEKEGDVDSSSDMGTTEIDVSKQIRIRTVDNFQGEEADIIILSLVRNSGEEKSKGIGFLRSSNRTNVALSRARHGMYVLGNGDALENGSGTWSTVIDEFRKQAAYGSAFPFACYRHPEDIQWLSNPKEIDSLFPDGRCLLPCGVKLKCGHACPSKCHPDDDLHIKTRCTESCGKLCPLGHPCSRMCYEECKCDFLGNVRLPCGHIRQNVTCTEARQPHKILCTVTVSKKYHGCEHHIDLPCDDNVSRYTCSTPCGKEMACCSQKCKSPCSSCRLLSPRRTQHCQHPCDKILHCQHSCTDACAPGHQCICRQRCRQTCEHTQCREGCAKPCTPCAGKCTWICPHQACSVSCGSPCNRLPCDIRCQATLKCGHPCPSLCGEPCDRQLCPICATPDQKNQVVDLIMQTTLGDADLSGEDLDSVLITLECQHTFTVETLDGVCGLSDYYQRDEGRWVKPILPSAGSLKAPVCPHCRGEIQSKRYGRVLKRCNLDLLERTVATNTATRLQRVTTNHLSLIPSTIKSSIIPRAIPTQFETLDTSRLLLITTQYEDCKRILRDKPFDATNFWGPRLTIDYGFRPEIANSWNNQLKEVHKVYLEAYSIAATRSAHRTAYESALSRLYHEELSRMTAGYHTRAADQEAALGSARIKVGMAPPLADRRFFVEATWVTIELRLIIASIASDLQESIAKAERENQSTFSRALRWMSSAPAPDGQSRALTLFVEFILSSCTLDAQMVLKTAETSGASRQVLKCELKLMRITLNEFNFKVRQLQGEKAADLVTKRKRLAAIAKEQRIQAQLSLNRATDTHFKRKGQTAEEVAWVDENFMQTATEVIEKWSELIKKLNGETFFQPVSVEEKRLIQQAFASEFTHRGHWYTCPNGHVFVIGECGGAMQVSRCNECGAQIGGSSHQLLNSNARAREFEEIAREQGAEQSPWRWGRDA